MKFKFLVGLVFLFITNIYSQNIAEKLISIEEMQSLENIENSNYYFYFPEDIETDSKGNVYVVDTFNNRIQVFDINGSFLRTIGRGGTGPLEFNKPADMCIDERNKIIYVSDTRNRRVQICSLEGRFIRSIKLKFSPQRIILRDSHLYISILPLIQSSTGKGLIKKCNANGEIIHEFLSLIEIKEIGLYSLYNMILMKKDKSENLVIARKWGFNQVMIFDIYDRVKKEFEIIYKGSKWIKPGITDFPLKSDEDIDKIPFIIADLTFDTDNNYYFLAGNIERKKDGSFERRREIYKYSYKGAYRGTIILPIPAKLIHIDKFNNLYIIDDNFIMRKYRILDRQNER